MRAVALNGLGVTRLYQGELRDAARLFNAAVEINEATGRETSALANRGNLASVLRQLGEEARAAELLTEVLAAYRKVSNLRGELSTWMSGASCTGSVVTPPPRWRRRGEHTT